MTRYAAIWLDLEKFGDYYSINWIMILCMVAVVDEEPTSTRLVARLCDWSESDTDDISRLATK